MLIKRWSLEDCQGRMTKCWKVSLATDQHPIHKGASKGGGGGGREGERGSQLLSMTSCYRNNTINYGLAR